MVFIDFVTAVKSAALLSVAKNRRKVMKLKVSRESETGINTEFVNIDSGRKIKLEQAIRQVEQGNPSYKNYMTVKKSNGTTYLRSKPNGSLKDNIE